METKTKWNVFASCCLAVGIGSIGASLAMRERAVDDAFERGRQQGLRECNEPSKLEKAAKWLAE